MFYGNKEHLNTLQSPPVPSVHLCSGSNSNIFHLFPVSSHCALPFASTLPVKCPYLDNMQTRVPADATGELRAITKIRWFTRCPQPLVPPLPEALPTQVGNLLRMGVPAAGEDVLQVLRGVSAAFVGSALTGDITVEWLVTRVGVG